MPAPAGADERVVAATTRIPYAFPAPLVAWAQFDVRADGTLEQPPCVESSRPPVVGSSRLAPVIAAGHAAPMPFCRCGVHGLYRPPDRPFDGSRTVGLVELWGRVMLESDGVRAQHGRVLAVAEAGEDFDPSAFERMALPGAMWLRRPDFARAVRARGIRHWRSGTNQGPELTRMSLTMHGGALGAIALGFALVAFGLAGWASVAIAVLSWIALGLFAMVRTNERTVCVEALVPPPEGEAPGAPLELERGRRAVDLGPVRGALPFVK